LRSPLSDGSRRAISLFPHPRNAIAADRQHRRGQVTAAINRDIRTAYLQLAFVCLFVLLAALVGAEKLIISPIES